MLGHQSGGLPPVGGQQGLKDGQVFVRLFGQPLQTVMRLIVFPRNVAEGAEHGFQPANLLGQKSVAARPGDQVVQPAVEAASLLKELGALPRFNALQSLELGGQRTELERINAAAGAAHGLALQGAANLANLRTSRPVTRRTTAPRFGSRSITPVPASDTSASRIGV